MLSPTDLEKIKEVSLVEAIGREVHLKQKGSEWVGLSPFTGEKSGSFTINETKRIWKCFSSGFSGKTAHSFYQKLDEENGGSGNWIDAMKKVAALMNIVLEGVQQAPAAKAKFEKRSLKPDEKPGDKFFEYRDFTDAELKILGPRVNAALCQRFNLHACERMTLCKENEVYEISSTPEYPIFVFNNKTWQKIYQPKAENKAQRFSYAGEKPARHVFGMDVIAKAFNKNKEDLFKENEGADEKIDPRLDAVYIMSGGSDGLNLASLGEDYYPIWFNSESESVEYEEYKLLNTYAKNIYYVADLDATGRREAIKLGLKFLDIKLVWLPESLKQFRDGRGNPCKDFKDYVTKFYNKENGVAFFNTFKKLIENSLQFQFWNVYWKEKKNEYFLSNTRLYHFLKCQGFGRYEHQNLKDGYIYVKVDGSIIRVLEPYQISNFVHSFLEERGMPSELRDYVYNSPKLSEKSLANLPRIEIDFTVADRETQYLFFPNGVWKITKDGIEDFKPGQIDRYIWEDKVIDVRPGKPQTPPFEIFKDEHGDLDIKIHAKNNHFLNYLINASRIHWRKETEDSFDGKTEVEAQQYFKENQFNIEGPNLNADEIYEQKLHLINKIYSIGYLLHQYKNESRGWCVFAMDGKISDSGESHGGSGKSVCYANQNYILKRRVVLKGRDPKLTQNDFIYSSVTEDTDYILIDDAHQYLNFGFFFSEITGSIIVNPKNQASYEIPFAKAPKFVITSNHTPRDVDPSTARRILYTVFSDWYHFNKDNHYKQERLISDDFGGRNLFKDFTPAEWIDFINFEAYACAFYLWYPFKINPPMDNVTKRNLISEMGQAFKDWADMFFATKAGEGGDMDDYLYRDEYFSKESAFTDFKVKYSPKNWTPQRFKKALLAYCQYNDWILNPSEAGTKDGRIMKKFEGVTQEVIWIKTGSAIQFGEEPQGTETDPGDVERAADINASPDIDF